MRRATQAAIVLLALLSGSAAQQLGKSIASDSQIDRASNKYLQRTADLNLEREGEGVEGKGECGAGLELRWMREVSSSVYATPMIADLFSDGVADIVVPTFAHHVEVLEGADGRQLGGWPAYHASPVHTSPLRYDADGDGILDILIATYDGEILFFKDTGEKLDFRIVVPRLHIRKDWFVGLAPDHVDHSNPDISSGTKNDDSGTSGTNTGARHSRVLLQDGGNAGVASSDVGDVASGVANDGSQAVADGVDGGNIVDHGNANAAADGLPDFEEETGGDAAAMAQDDMSALGRDPYWDYDDDLIFKQYADDAGWRSDKYEQKFDTYQPEYVWVDAHILATPTIADIDGDGSDELVIPVSYFYDQEYYTDATRLAQLGKDVDITNYVGGGVVVYDIRLRSIKWSTHLDLSTDKVQYRAYMYSSPTVVDLDGDGKMEIIVGSGIGFVYVLRHDGTARPGWPIQMGEIQSQVVVADVDNDGEIEILAGDNSGSFAVLRADGTEVWETHTRGSIAAAATLGDINGDGQLEVVFGTSSGHIHALNAATGRSVAGFPFQTHGKIAAQSLIVRLRDGPTQQIVVMSFDGHLYIIDGGDGCVDAVDLGEPSYAAALTDDLNGDGRLDIVVATMNGVIYAFETPAPYHSLKTWTSATQGRNGWVARHDWVGIAASPSTRQPTDHRGTSFVVQLDIVDKRPPLTGSAAAINNGSHAPYNVKIILEDVGVEQMNAGDQPVIGLKDTFQKPGTYLLDMPCPRSRTTAAVRIEMTDKHGMMYVDTFSASFHIHFNRLFKWMIAGPFIAMCIALLATRQAALQDILPS